MAVLLKNNEWKHNLESDPSVPSTSLVNLYDLLYDDNNEAWGNYTDQSSCGVKLAHDIICYQSSMYLSSGAVDTSYPLSSNDWQYRGIDIALSAYDSRANHKLLKESDLKSLNPKYSNEVVKGNGDSINIWNSSNVPLLYDKDAAMPPKTLELFTKSGIFQDQSADAIAAEANWQNYKAPSVSIGSSLSATSDIVLSAQDTVFRSTLVKKDGYYAFNKIFININTTFAALLLIKTLGINYSVLTSNVDESSNFSTITLSMEDIKVIIEDIPTTLGWDVWKKLLKNTFVWVRSAFYGDYVNTDSFNQDLNQSSSVVFKDLMLSGAGDFKKYDEFYSATGSNKTLRGSNEAEINNGRSEDTEPYIPITSPTVDFYTASFTSKLGLTRGTTNTNYTSQIKTTVTEEFIEKVLDQYISGNDAIIQGLPLAPISRAATSDNVASDKNLLPPGYLDPEGRNIGKDIKSMGKVPTILPNSGNLYVDGRIISPTIDEIWYLLKKLIMGRESDIITTEEGTTPANQDRAIKNDYAIPYGSGEERVNNTDSSLVEVPNSEYNFTYENTVSKKGDPIGYEYKMLNNNINNKYLYVNKFVNNNNSIVYPIYKSLKDISDRVTSFDEERKVENFTAWDSIGESSQVVEENSTITSGVWSPREVPFSLRELEALIRGNKYNLITFIRFVKENFTVSGKLGKVSNENDPTNKSAGSLYQLHSNYNYVVDDPNTWYTRDGTETGIDSKGKTVGTKSIYKDEDLRDESQLSSNEYRYRRGYGTSEEISENTEIVSSSRVYMAADGTWRNIDSFVRFPILRDDY